MTVAVVILAVIVGGLCVLGLVGVIEDHVRDRAVAEAWDDVVQDLIQMRYVGAWEALSGTPSRLRLFAEASDQLSEQCRRDAIAGRPPTLVDFGEDGYQLPTELFAGAARPGHQELWQPLDRALRRLEAIYPDSDASLHADAHEQVSIAARALVDELDRVDLELCSFCGQSAQRLLCSAQASICEACVQACHDQLHGV